MAPGPGPRAAAPRRNGFASAARGCYHSALLPLGALWRRVCGGRAGDGNSTLQLEVRGKSKMMPMQTSAFSSLSRSSVAVASNSSGENELVSLRELSAVRLPTAPTRPATTPTNTKVVEHARPRKPHCMNKAGSGLQHQHLSTIYVGTASSGRRHTASGVRPAITRCPSVTSVCVLPVLQ